MRFPGKHSVTIMGAGMTEGIVRKLKDSGIFQRVVIFSKDPEMKSSLGEIIPDPTQGTILESVNYAMKEFGDIFAFGGDMPFLCVDLISSMVSQFSGRTFCPISPEGIRQTLHCIYAGNDAGKLASYINAGGKTLHGFVEESGITMEYATDKEKCFENVNYQSDLDRLGLS